MAIIETSKLTKIYGKGDATVTALKDVNLSVDKGEFVAIMGPSGGGKSTLLNLIGGLDKPTSGMVMINNTDISTMKDNTITKMRRRMMGFIFQFFNLIPVLNATENAALPLILDGKKHAKALKTAVDWLKKIGLTERLTNRPDQLSGGQQQRVAVARALVADPNLILADEPTGNLDTKSSNEIAGLLQMVSEQWERSVVMVTHDPQIASHAKRIIFLTDSRVTGDVKIGSKEEAREAIHKAGLL